MLKYDHGHKWKTFLLVLINIWTKTELYKLYIKLELIIRAKSHKTDLSRNSINFLHSVLLNGPFMGP